MATHQKEPEGTAGTCDGPGDEDEKDDPEETKDGVAGHDCIDFSNWKVGRGGSSKKWSVGRLDYR